jgi:hypothetical protein
MHLSECSPGSYTADMSTYHIDRRDFVKIVTAFLGSVMAAVVGIPAIGYLVSPGLRSEGNDVVIHWDHSKTILLADTRSVSFYPARSSMDGKDGQQLLRLVVRPDETSFWCYPICTT